MYTTSDFREGLAILYQGEPYEIPDRQHHKPGKGQAIVRTRLRNLLTVFPLTRLFVQEQG